MNKLMELLKQVTFKTFNGMFFRNENKIVLDKGNNYNNLNVKFSNKFIKAKNSDHIKLMSKNIKNFLIVMNRDCKNFKPDLLLNNFKKTLFDLSEIGNGYVSGNVARIIENNTKMLGVSYKISSFSACNHELLHLATIKLLKCGFKVYVEDKSFAQGFNEGYTQLLAERYFNENKRKVYFPLSYFCEAVERIIGKDKMETYYFQTSLKSLINDLRQYETEDNIIDFIKNMDLLFKNDIEEDVVAPPEQINNFQHAINKISNFLLSCFKSKIDTIMKDESIEDKETSLDFVLSYEFFTKLITTKYTFDIFPDYKIDSFFDYIDEQFNLIEPKKGDKKSSFFII